VHQLELRVRDFGQMFNSMDPTPFLNKNLDREAEAFIEAWALGFPPDSQLHITIHLEHLPTEGDSSALMTEAIHNYFNYKSGLVRRDLKQILKQGLSACLSASSSLLCVWLRPTLLNNSELALRTL